MHIGVGVNRVVWELTGTFRTRFAVPVNVHVQVGIRVNVHSKVVSVYDI